MIYKVIVIYGRRNDWTDTCYNCVPLYEEFCEKYKETGYLLKDDENWMKKFFQTGERVKMDLFRRFGFIAAAGDRHLAFTEYRSDS